MEITEEVSITGSRDAVWKTITDIENCTNVISSIIKITVLDKPASGLTGLKWQETREMFGKEATETMWVTEAALNEYYMTRAESHGSVYLTRLSLRNDQNQVFLTMSFSGQAQTLTAKILSFLMAPLIKTSIKKALRKDLNDIKTYVENSQLAM